VPKVGHVAPFETLDDTMPGLWLLLQKDTKSPQRLNNTRHLSPMQLLAHSPPVRWGRELEGQKCENSWAEIKTA